MEMFFILVWQCLQRYISLSKLTKLSIPNCTHVIWIMPQVYGKKFLCNNFNNVWIKVRFILWIYIHVFYRGCMPCNGDFLWFFTVRMVWKETYSTQTALRNKGFDIFFLGYQSAVEYSFAMLHWYWVFGSMLLHTHEDNCVFIRQNYGVGKVEHMKYIVEL